MNEYNVNEAGQAQEQQLPTPPRGMTALWAMVSAGQWDVVRNLLGVLGDNGAPRPHADNAAPQNQDNNRRAPSAA